jgi:hypothetical protein
MRAFVFGLLLLPAIGFAQRKSKGYFSFNTSLHFKSKTDPGFGGLLSGNLQVSKEFFAGVQIGALKLPNTDGVYVPLQAKFTIAPSFNSNKVSPIMLIEPVYGIHNKTYQYYWGSYTEEGGFTFFAGGGILLPASARGGLLLAVGYSSFGFKSGNETTNLEMVGVRLGVYLK